MIKDLRVIACGWIRLILLLLISPGISVNLLDDRFFPQTILLVINVIALFGFFLIYFTQSQIETN